MKKRLYLFAFLTLSLFTISCSDDDDNQPMVEPTPNIVEAAQATTDLSLLVDALVQADAGLVDLLQTNGPFTVFAPTNQAFADLLEILGDDYNSLADFDTAEEETLLTDILTYHVIAGAEAYSTDLSDGQMIETAQGESITVSLDGGVFIQDTSDTDAQVTAADVATSNGVVHIIDKVILPEAIVNSLRPNIVETAMAVSDLSLLVDALVQADAGLVDLLQTDGPFTVFAPTNQAFADLLDALGDDYNSLADFDTTEEKELLAGILTYHVVAGTAAYSTDLSDGQMIETAQGQSITVSLDGGVFIQDATDTDAQVTAADVATSNGVVHIIDKVLLPNT
ncbi:MAG TPA: fasciclin domain-containing protein [Flavobacteriaceae bacterium]|nr:fasciclin domain-containing protein [Flavobacteriaceae bacterium]